MKNIFELPDDELADPSKELLTTLLTGDNGLRVERIISCGHVTPQGEWYDQAENEWVVLLEGAAELEYEKGEKVKLKRGDTLFLPKHVKHRVSYTSPFCVWLAVHGNLKLAPKSF